MHCLKLLNLKNLRTLSTYRNLNKNYAIVELPEDKEYEALITTYLGSKTDYNCFIIHPYIKWGPQKVFDTKPKQQLEEAESLIRTLAPWSVHSSTTVPLETFDRKQLFGKGTLEALTNKIKKTKEITAVFINTSKLKNAQLDELEVKFNKPIFDRYKIVIQILRLHAVSKHAKLQVALAEIPYLHSKLKKYDAHFMASSDFDTRRVMLLNREKKLKAEIKKLRSHRELLRKKRRDNEYPTVAVVGYTNAGKTSLIKALTGDVKLQPRNQLFSTLDVTLHAGLLPSRLEVLYVDTVGFISDIPTNLIECFVATLEDAMYADVILHVNDVSSHDYLFQRKHVASTLQNLAEKTNTDLLGKIITVSNKCDIAKFTNENDTLAVSAKSDKGIGALKLMLEELILKLTNRTVITIRIPIGSEEIRWLYKNATVVSVQEDTADSQFQKVKVIIMQSKLQQFRHHFCK